ncbi:MAG TPA: NAD(P)H-binding protein [Steroidobacter sp.]|nr:NAD(P)H-binding protein [Steroidobacter sp.]
MIAVMGASGNTGSGVAEALLTRGVQVRAIGRSREKLEPLISRGAQAAIGDASDEDFLAGALRGAHAAYVLLTADPGARDYRAAQDAIGESIVGALRSSAVRRVVALSSIGADKDRRTGVIAGLRAQEERLRSLTDVDLWLLRPASFFENFSAQIAQAAQEGYLAGAIDANLPIPMVAARDVSQAATGALLDDQWSGVMIQELLGPRDITHVEIAGAVAKTLGVGHMRYAQLPYEAMAALLEAFGASPSFAQCYVEMAHAINERSVGPLRGRTPENTTGTTFEAFVRELTNRQTSAGDFAEHVT